MNGNGVFITNNFQSKKDYTIIIPFGIKREDGK